MIVASYRCRHQCNRCLRSPVRLAAGLTEDGGSQRSSGTCALLPDKFGQRLRDLPSEQVRSGHQRAKTSEKAGNFGASRESLGHRIEIIPGVEEARPFISVCYSIADDHRRRIVADIGGGSTECILGSDYKPITRHSLYMGV